MAAPVVQNQRPADGATLVAPRQPAYLEITDADADLDASTVVLKYNGRVAWTGDAAQDGFAVTKTAITNGFSYSIAPAVLPDRGGQVQINVYAEDALAASVSDIYYYILGVSEYLIWYDGFADASLDPRMTVTPGNGIVTEPAGTELKLDCPNSVSCNWWTSNYSCPHVHYPIESWLKDRPEGVFQVTGKLSNLVDTTANVLAGIVIHVDSQNAYFGAFHESPNDHRLERAVANAFANRYHSGDGRPHPNGGNTVYRIVWNDSGKTYRFLNNTTLQHGQITFLYSENSGSTWVRAYTETMAIPAKGLVGFGAWLKKWDATAVNAQGYFDYIELRELLHSEDLTQDQEAGQGAQVEIDVGIGDLGGPEVHGIGRGVRLPGPPGQELGSLGPFDDVQIEIAVVGEVQDPLTDPSLLRLPEAPHDAQMEIVAEGFLSVLTDYRTTTSDFNGHPHFIGERVLTAFVYDAVGEAGPWTTPTDPSFTGYGKDGNYYVNGVDQGSNAPWYDEAESDDRGPTLPFPDKVLICYTAEGTGFTPKEVVIFDLDNFPTTLDMWMRFKFGPSGGNYTMMGRINQKATALAMANGIMSVVMTEGDYRGALHMINFIQPGKDCGHYIRSDNHLVWQPATEIAGRNLTGASQWTTSGVTISLRNDSEQIYSVAMRADGADTWVAIAGEDVSPNLYKLSGTPVKPTIRVRSSGPDLGPVNVGDIRRVAFDEDGNWWIAIEDYIHRVLEYDYKEGYSNLDLSVPNVRRGAADEWVRLPHDVTTLTAVGNYLFVGTAAGVYRIHRGSMEYRLAYTIEGGGGGGTGDSPPAGELLPGADAGIVWCTGHALHSAHYLHIATSSVVVTIRTLDDKIVDSREYPDLHWPGAHFNVATVD